MFDFTADDSFEIEKTIHYILSIQVSLDGFSFTAFDELNKRVVAFKTTPLKISSESLLVRHFKDWLESESFLKKRFKNVRIFVDTASFTLIPDEFSEDKLAQDLKPLIFKEDIAFEFTENHIAVLNARLIFPVHSYLIGLLNQFFGSNKEILHPVSAFLSNPVVNNKRNSAFIIISQRFFHLVIYQNYKLVLANSFQYFHQSDLVYMVLNSFQQLEIARSETELFVCGTFSNNSEIESLITPYFSHISKLKPVQTIDNDEVLNDSLQLYLTVI